MSEAKREVWVREGADRKPQQSAIHRERVLPSSPQRCAGHRLVRYVPESAQPAERDGEWVSGSPDDAGHYWIHWRTLQGEWRTEAVNIGPAVLTQTGRLLLKLGSGAAYQYEPNRESISHYMPITAPQPPQPKEKP